MSALAFLESASNNMDEVITIGGFRNANLENGFDNCFESAVEQLENKNLSYFRDINQMIRNTDIMEAFKESALSGMKAESDSRADADKWGNYSNMYEQLNQLWDNCTTDFVKESTTVGQLMPIKAIDYPILVKQHVSLATKDIMQTEVTKSPLIKKQIEQTWIVDNNPVADGEERKRWRYPQCFYTNEAQEIWGAGKGLPIKDTQVNLPLFNFDIIKELTDAITTNREKFTIDLKVVKVIAGEDDNAVEIPVNMCVSLHTNQWMNGNIDVTVTNKEGESVEIKDSLTGTVDFINNKVSLSSASGQVKAVVFGGYLSNEKNERSVGIDYTRETMQWAIEDGHRVQIPYSIEQLDDAKALLNIDLYKKTYDNLGEYLTQMEDSQIIEFLDKEFEKNAGIEVDPLGWNSMIFFKDFNCDSTNITSALPCDFIERQLKWTIERFLIDITETIKMENMTFVIYGNPKYVSLLGESVKWSVNNGSRTGGIRHNYSYGVMSVNGIHIQVVSALKFSTRNENHKGLRITPIALDPTQMTFKHYKYNTHILTARDSAYRSPDLPGGSYTNLVGMSRYKDAVLQGVQGLLTFSNSQFIDSSFQR